MVNKKILFFALIFTLISNLLIGCGKSKDNSNEDSDGENIKITMLNSKGEIQNTLEEGAEEYSKNHKNVTIEINPAPEGVEPLEKISALYNAGNAPVLQLLDGGDIIKLKDKYLDLSDEKWIDDLIENSVDNFTFDGEILAFPLTVEGYGMIYNKKVVGNDFDKNKLSTIKGLESTLKDLKDNSLVIPSMNWSLGAHFFTLVYALESETYNDADKLFTSLKSGDFDLNKSDSYNGLLDSFDIMKKYNVAKNDPLAVTYEKGIEMIGKGKVGLWFMGNWAWPEIENFSDGNEEFAFAPVPISNNENDYGNKEIVAGITKLIAIDKEQNSEEQQKAAKDFLNWLVYEKEGQNLLVNKCNIVPAFNNITLEPTDPLGQSMKEYIDNNQTLLFMNVLPSNHWDQVGAFMQEYLDNRINRKELATKIEDYWKTISEK